MAELSVTEVEQTLQKNFPGAMPASTLLRNVQHSLSQNGFTGENTIGARHTQFGSCTRSAAKQVSFKAACKADQLVTDCVQLSPAPAETRLPGRLWTR